MCWHVCSSHTIQLMEALIFGAVGGGGARQTSVLGRARTTGRRLIPKVAPAGLCSRLSAILRGNFRKVSRSCFCREKGLTWANATPQFEAGKKKTTKNQSVLWRCDRPAEPLWRRGRQPARPSCCSRAPRGRPGSGWDPRRTWKQGPANLKAPAGKWTARGTVVAKTAATKDNTCCCGRLRPGDHFQVQY